MSQEQLDRMENMLSNLIKIVGTLNNDFQEMKEEMQEMKEEMQELKADVRELKADVHELKAEMKNVKKDIEGIKKEQEVTNRILTDMRADQDHIWEKAARNERELAKLKIHLQL